MTGLAASRFSSAAVPAALQRLRHQARALVRAVSARRWLVELNALNDDLLEDIGLRRSDLIEAEHLGAAEAIAFLAGRMERRRVDSLRRHRH